MPGKKYGLPDYACRWETQVKSIKAEEGDVISLEINLTNSGRRSWKSTSPEAPCLLSYHLLDSHQKVLRFDNPRFAFPVEVKPGQKVPMKVRLLAPLSPGRYFLEFDLVLEGKAWFQNYGSKTLLLPLEVKAVTFPEDSLNPGLKEAPFTLYQTEIEAINRLQRLIRLTLRHGEVKIKGKSGEVSGFMAGTGYPQIWVRDSATIIPASRLFYKEEFLRSWLEEILNYQEETGSIPDWVDFSGKVDKNTTESDQESSAIQAASALVRLLGQERGKVWLEKKIGGERIIDRLQQALFFLLHYRYDSSIGLITGAHTADWGDVETGDPDQKAIYADSRTQWTVDIYDQSMFYQACLELSFLWTIWGEKKLSSFWQKKAAEIKARANELLWQEKKGFYRVHHHLTPFAHDFDEDNMFALGGNTVAILSGLANFDQAQRIIQEALNRKQAFSLSTISGCLLPPYPQGFFSHPMMDDPYEYQNGGQWDWFGGRLVAAMYEYGESQEATRCLLEIAKKNLERGGFYEWDTPQGEGKGSENYAGSAGALALALYQGFLGFNIDQPVPTLSPRIGWGKARAQIYLPTSGNFYAYDYDCDQEGLKIEFSFNSNDRRLGQVRLLWPWGSSRQPELKFDGQPKEFKIEKVGQDFYLVISTDLFSHRLQVLAR